MWTQPKHEKHASIRRATPRPLTSALPGTGALLATIALLATSLPAAAAPRAAQEGGVGPGDDRPVPEPDTLALTLERAEELALEGRPRLRARRREIDIARGERRQAGVYRFNPRIEFESKRIDPRAGRSPLDRYEAAIVQEVEWAGQWGLRQDVAEHDLNRARASMADAERRTLRDVRRAFYAAEAAERRVGVAREIAGLNRRFRDAVAEERAQGEVSALDANLARIEYGRARGRTLTAERERRSAVLDLTRILGLDPDTIRVLPASGRPADGSGSGAGAGGPNGASAASARLPDPAALSRDSLVALAMSRRPDLLAAEAAVDRERERERLARREAIPNLRIAAPVERERPGGSPVIGLGVGFSVPLWNRNQGTADARRASLLRSRDRRSGVLLRIRTQVRDALQAYRSASEAARVLEESTLQPARQNHELLQESYRAGKIDLPTLLLLRDQLLDAELAYWDAWLARRQAYARLRAAVGDEVAEPTPEEDR